MVKGDNVLLKFWVVGKKRKALEVVPDLVKILAGVMEISTQEMMTMRRFINDQF